MSRIENLNIEFNTILEFLMFPAMLFDPGIAVLQHDQVFGVKVFVGVMLKKIRQFIYHDRGIPISHGIGEHLVLQ